MTGQYDGLVRCAPLCLLPPESIAGPGGDAKAEWIGIGAAVAASWLESNREYTVIETRDFWFIALFHLFKKFKYVWHMPDDASGLFLAGFNWVLQFEVPGPDAAIH